MQMTLRFLLTLTVETIMNDKHSYNPTLMLSTNGVFNGSYHSISINVTGCNSLGINETKPIGTMLATTSLITAR